MLRTGRRYTKMEEGRGSFLDLRPSDEPATEPAPAPWLSLAPSRFTNVDIGRNDEDEDDHHRRRPRYKGLIASFKGSERSNSRKTAAGSSNSSRACKCRAIYR